MNKLSLILALAIVAVFFTLTTGCKKTETIEKETEKPKQMTEQEFRQLSEETIDFFIYSYDERMEIAEKTKKESKEKFEKIQAKEKKWMDSLKALGYTTEEIREIDKKRADSLRPFWKKTSDSLDSIAERRNKIFEEINNNQERQKAHNKFIDSIRKARNMKPIKKWNEMTQKERIESEIKSSEFILKNWQHNKENRKMNEDYRKRIEKEYNKIDTIYIVDERIKVNDIKSRNNQEIWDRQNKLNEDAKKLIKDEKRMTIIFLVSQEEKDSIGKGKFLYGHLGDGTPMFMTKEEKDKFEKEQNEGYEKREKRLDSLKRIIKTLK